MDKLHERLMKSLSVFKVLFLLVLFLMGFVAFEQETAAAAASGNEKVLRLAINSEYNTLDPHLSSDIAERNISFGGLYESLVSTDPDFNIVPQLAISWSFPDDLTILFKLHQGVKFHDGTDFNAQVVKWNIERVKNPDTVSPYRKMFDDIKSVEVIGPYDVKLNLARPSPSLLASLAADRPGFMLSPTAVEKWKADYGRHPVGTGPYKFQEWVKDDHTTLLKNESYWDKSNPPRLDRIIFKPVPDSSVRVAMLRSKQVDMIDDVNAQDVRVLESAGFKTVGRVTGGWFEVGFRTDLPPFNNLALRQAIAYAVNKKQVVDIVAFGAGEPGHGPIAAGWAYNKDLKTYEFDLTMAKQKLKEAKGNGYDGSKLVLQVAAQPQNQKIAQVVQQQLSAIELPVEIKSVDLTQHWKMEVEGTTNFWIERWMPRPDPGYALAMHFTTGQYGNVMRYKNDQVEKLIAEANSKYDQKVRLPLIQKAEQLVVTDAPKVWLYHPKFTQAMAPNVIGYRMYLDTFIRTKELDIQ